MESIFIRDDAPRDEGESDELPRPSPGGYLTVSDAGLFATEEELKNLAAGAAIPGGPVEPSLMQIREGYAARLTALGQQVLSVVEHLDEGIREAREKINAGTLREQSLDLSIAEQRRLKQEVDASVRRLDLEVETTLQEIRKLRFDHGKEFFDRQGSYLNNEIRLTKDEILQNIRDKRHIAEEIYNLQKEHWLTNKNEFDRRARLFEEEQKRVEEQLRHTRERTARLHVQGITRTTTSFLIWVGYISLAGAGGVIGSFFQKRLSGDTEFLSLIFRGLITVAHTIQPAQDKLGPWWAVVAPLPLVALVVLYLFIIGGAVLFMDKRMKQFDPTWDKDQGRGKDRRKGRRGVSRLNLTDRFASYMPTPDVDRKTYRQLLAYFPFVVVAALVVWLFAAGIPQGNGSSGSVPDPTFGLAAAYLGVIFILLSTSAALLYTTKIIEPRWRKFEENGGGSGGGNRGGGARSKLEYVKLNWEIVLLVVLLVVSLTLTAVLPTGSGTNTPPAASWMSVGQANLISWGAVAIFMCLCSLGLAYGLIQRGLFRDEEFFERLRQKYRLLVEKNRVSPTIYEIFEKDGPFEEVEPLLTKYREAKHMLDEYRMIYELKEIFADDFDEDPAFNKLFRKIWDEPHFSLRSVRVRAVPAGEPRPIDYVVCPHETRRLLASKAERKADQDKSLVLAGDILRLEQEKLAARDELERLNKLVSVRKRKRLDVMREYEVKRSALAERREKDILKFQAAFTLCRVGYVHLRDDLGLTAPPRVNIGLTEIDEQPM